MTQGGRRAASEWRGVVVSPPSTGSGVALEGVVTEGDSCRTTSSTAAMVHADLEWKAPTREAGAPSTTTSIVVHCAIPVKAQPSRHWRENSGCAGWHGFSCMPRHPWSRRSSPIHRAPFNSAGMNSPRGTAVPPPTGSIHRRIVGARHAVPLRPNATAPTRPRVVAQRGYGPARPPCAVAREARGGGPARGPLHRVRCSGDQPVALGQRRREQRMRRMARIGRHTHGTRRSPRTAPTRLPPCPP